MSDFIVTARKWRPMKFDDVVGQSHVTATIRNAIAAKRLAHAYLFSGPRGVGKTTVARLLAKAVNCLHLQENNPDNTCEICTEINDGRSFDVLEIDGASNRGVEEIRNLRESVRYPPAKGTYKVYIIDEVHMLTKEAFNALLKTLEEPPSHILFIFATTEIQRVPPTIVSRCQRFEFRRIAVGEIVANLRLITSLEGVRIDEDALRLIAKKGEGSLRDAQSIFDQVVSLCGREITLQQIVNALNLVDQEVFFRVTDLIKARDTKSGLALVDELMSGGYDIREFLSGLVEHLRNILITNVMGSPDLVEASDVYKKRYAEEAKEFSVADLLRLQRMVSGTDAAMRGIAQPRFKLEADIVQLISMPGASEVGELIERLEEMKGKLPDDGPESNRPNPPLVSGVHIVQATPASPSRPSSPPASHPTIEPPHRPAETHQPPRSSTESVPGSVSTDEVLAHWTEIVGEVRKQRPGLASVLESSTVVGIRGATVRVGCANDFEAGSIRRQKDLLAETLSRVLNTRLRVEVEIKSELPSGPPPTQKQSPPADGGIDDEHPIIKAMKRELGAEPL